MNLIGGLAILGPCNMESFVHKLKNTDRSEQDRVKACHRLLSGLVFSGIVLVASAAAAQMPQSAAQQTKTSPLAAEVKINQRLDRLEEQLTDLQGAIGAFQSLAGSVTSPPSQPSAYATTGQGRDSGLQDRVEVLETQIQALSNQIQQLTEAMNRLQPQGRASGQGSPSSLYRQSWPGAPNTGPANHQAAHSGAMGTGWQTAALPSDPMAQSAFRAAYQNIVRQDYPAAEKAFKAFLQNFPSDPRAGEAYFWLGESHYLRGEYKAAARNFLLGARKHKTGPRAADTLLRLGMSLTRLGQKAAACKTFTQLQQQYPNMAAHIRRQANNERRRLGC